MAGKAQESLAVLLEVCQLLSSKIDLNDVLTTIIEASAEVVKAQRGSLFLVDPETNDLYFHVALGLQGEASRIRLKMGQGIVGTVAGSGSSEIINDVRSDRRWSPAVDLKSGFQTRSILAAPMKIKGQLIGVVEAINHIGGPFTPEDLRVFEAFATQAAIAIENARLFSSLTAEKSKLETVFTRMKDAAVLTDEAGKVILANEAAVGFLELGPAAGGTIGAALSGMAVAPALEGLCASTEPMLAFEAVRELPKKLILSGTASYLHFEGSGGASAWGGRLFVLRDVTDERQEEMLKRSFLSLISHKLKTPLASITGYAQILLDDGSSEKLPDMAARMVQTIMGQGRKLSELVDKLLRFTTIQDLDTINVSRKAFPIGEAVAQAVEALGPWLQAQGAVVAFKPEPGHEVFGDPALIRDAVKNLVENGVKFNQGGEKRVELRSETLDGFVALHVTDNGPGIPPEEHERIFSKFYQVEASFTGQIEGWGLGLAFVRKVAEQHGGRAALRSRLGEGTTVTVTIPAPPAAAPAGEAGAAAR